MEMDSGEPQLAERTQVEWLAEDIPEMRRLVDFALPSFLPLLTDRTDPERTAKYLVTADLVWRIWYLAIAIQVLLAQELYSPANVLTRSLWEAMATLAYLVKHPKFPDEALILLAFSFQKLVEQSPHQPELVKERTAILARMPAKLVDEARRRAKTKPFTWSGKTARQLGDAAGVTGHAQSYPFLSSEVHGTLVGENIKIIAPQKGEKKGEIKFGRQPGPRDIEALANFARRALHGAFKIMWRVFNGPKVQVQTPDPDLWHKAQKKSSP